MKFLDRLFQRWRIAAVSPYLAPNQRILDIGSPDGAIFGQVRGLSRDSLGIDPSLECTTPAHGVTLLPGHFPRDMPDAGTFDAITLLAVLEHFPASEYSELSSACARFLGPGGTLLITVPSPLVDHILAVLSYARLIDGMALEEHHGFDVADTVRIFCPPEFSLIRHRRFELGLNNLFVFRRC